MNASSASGLCATWMTRGAAAVTSVRAQNVGEQMGRSGTLDRVGLGKAGGDVAPGEMQQPDVVARIVIEGRELTVGSEGHREEEPDAIGLTSFRQSHHAVE